MSQDPDFKLLFDALPHLVLVLSPGPDFIMVAANERRLRGTNTRREDCIGRSIFEVFGRNPDEHSEFGAGVLRASLERVMHSRQPDHMAITKYDIPRVVGEDAGFEVRYWSPLNTPVLNDKGEVIYIIHQTEDVTEQVLARQRTNSDVRITDERMRAALLASESGIFDWYIDEDQFHCDTALQQLFGFPDVLTGDSIERFLQHVHPEDRQMVRQSLVECIHGKDFTVEFRLYRSAQERWLASKGKVFLDAAGKSSFVTGTCVDITARKHAENALYELNETLEARVAAEVAERTRVEHTLHQAQKMEAVGQLTGGIAHDFNNLLTGVIGSLELMQRRHQAGSSVDDERYINAAITSAHRAAALTQRLLAFSRRQTLDLKPIEVNQLVASLEDLLHRTTRENIEITTRLTAGLPLVSMDANQLESAVVNLAINARDAMPDGGTIAITTASVHVTTAEGKALHLSEGDYVMLEVTDTGVGMTPDVLTKVFEPFYTTKPIGQGTGLGLSMVYGSMRQAKGAVQILSQPGAGTNVQLYMPCLGREVGISEVEVNKEAPLGEGEIVLVVEDETVVRSLIVEVLCELGYQACEAADAQEAIPILESRQRIDLMISDVGLPGMNGRQLADLAQLRRPGLKVLLATGYAEGSNVSGYLASNMEIITKPFAIDTLANKIREMRKSSGEA
ncbi:hybrid sensor histidine kinase/response regulator [Pseudomonas syringae]|uniref:hybrid sensor histidine kinase/response regulator n=1 Tax=Pseudomonas syringae TaxID=317 RepID=UPI0018E62FF8|nr:ATP-binding protein [Pseudomonas syringae]MBI6743487.1 response regulator [Pseudomonas syringae]MBI6758870.1 response regulator [Pseudomonas syringae]MBI6828800.1 response regulator [Pseudomonas syringae]